RGGVGQHVGGRGAGGGGGRRRVALAGAGLGGGLGCCSYGGPAVDLAAEEEHEHDEGDDHRGDEDHGDDLAAAPIVAKPVPAHSGLQPSRGIATCTRTGAEVPITMPGASPVTVTITSVGRSSTRTSMWSRSPRADRFASASAS